jgi:hypothetical protein
VRKDVKRGATACGFTASQHQVCFAGVSCRER